MNTSDFDTPPTADDGFDARARRAHAAAQEALSPRVRAQLQQRRRAALADPRRAQGVRWVPTLAMAATLALAVGLGLRLWSPAAVDSDAHGDGAWLSDAQRGTATDATAGTATNTASDPTSQPDAPRNASTPALATAGDDAGPAAAPDRAAAGSAGDARTDDSATGSLDAELDAIASLLAAPATGEAGTPVDTAAADSAQDDALLAALEESPDFYLWLGDDDGAGVEAL